MAVALLALALLATPYDPHGRLTLSARAGGGWASDPYPGARMGAGAMADVVPGAVLDLALAPTVKASVACDAALAAFDAAGFQARSAGAGGELRLLRDRHELALTLRGDAAWFPEGAPAGDRPAAPRVTRALALAAGPVLRGRGDRLGWWAGASGALATSRTATDDVGEGTLGVDAGARVAVGDAVALSAHVEAARTWSPSDAFAARTLGCAAGASSRPWRALEVGARITVRRTAFDTGVDEDQLRAALDVSHPVGPVTALVALSSTRAWTSDGAVTRHLVYAGVRGSVRALAW